MVELPDPGKSGAHSVRLFLCLNTGRIGRQRLSAVRDDRCGHRLVVDWASVDDSNRSLESTVLVQRLLYTTHVGSWWALRAQFPA
eukprot:3790213-Pleurochrysis_carterae.AAC.2